MFLAIINETYSDVKSSIKKENMPIGQFVIQKIMKLGFKMCFCKNKDTCMWKETKKDELNNLDTKE